MVDYLYCKACKKYYPIFVKILKKCYICENKYDKLDYWEKNIFNSNYFLKSTEIDRSEIASIERLVILSMKYGNVNFLHQLRQILGLDPMFLIQSFSRKKKRPLEAPTFYSEDAVGLSNDFNVIERKVFEDLAMNGKEICHINISNIFDYLSDVKGKGIELICHTMGIHSYVTLITTINEHPINWELQAMNFIMKGKEVQPDNVFSYMMERSIRLYKELKTVDKIQIMKVLDICHDKLKRGQIEDKSRRELLIFDISFYKSYLLENLRTYYNYPSLNYNQYKRNKYVRKGWNFIVG